MAILRESEIEDVMKRVEDTMTVLSSLDSDGEDDNQPPTPHGKPNSRDNAASTKPEREKRVRPQA